MLLLFYLPPPDDQVADITLRDEYLRSWLSCPALLHLGSLRVHGVLSYQLVLTETIERMEHHLATIEAS